MKKNDLIKYLILAVLIYFPIFRDLDTLPIRLVDESRLAISAYEMYKGGDWIVIHFDGKPDMENTKPPLMIWSQVILMKIIGVNELSVRLPSAIAAFLTCIALMFFSKKYLKSFGFGFIAVLVLITSSGYISEHVSRTGDYDALVTLFATLYCLFFFLFVETKKNKYLYYFFISISIAVLTKSTVALLFLPALLIYTLIQKQFINTIKNKHFYLGLGIFLVTTLGYYFLRESYNSGYIKAAIENELTGRYLRKLVENKHGFLYYYNEFINTRLIWFLFVPCGLVLGLFHKDEKFFKITLYSSLLVLTFFIVISTAQTKLIWYASPMYPLLAMLISIFIYFIFIHLKNLSSEKGDLKFKAVPYIFLFLIFFIPYQKIIRNTTKENYLFTPDQRNVQVSYFLKSVIEGRYDASNHFLLYEDNYQHNWFYLRILQDKGINITYKDWKNLNTNDNVIVYQPDIKEYIKNNYNSEIINTYKNITVYKIQGEKIIN